MSQTPVPTLTPRSLRSRRPSPVEGEGGLTLIEILVATAITVVIALAIFYFYTMLNQGLRRAEREIATLSAFRAFTAKLQKHLQFAVTKASYIPGEYAVFKPLHDGQFRIQWPGPENHLAGNGDYNDGKCRYLGFFTTEDGVHIDRVEYYFNPAEPKAAQFNGLDDDGDDDPDDQKNPHHLMRDDRGRIMFRRVRDKDLVLAAYSTTTDRDGEQTPPFRAPKLSGAGSEFDYGEILADGFSDLYFEFIYPKDEPSNSANQPVTKFKAAPRWPHTTRPTQTSSDDTGESWPPAGAAGRQPQGLSFITLPIAVRVVCEVQFGAETRRLIQTIPLPQSQWHELTRRARPNAP